MPMTMNKLTFHTENRDGRTVVYIKGELDLEVAPQMRSVMEPLVERTGQGLILNLRDLKYIDSTGIGILIGIVKARHSLQAPFSVEEIPPTIRKLFDMTGIMHFLSVTN